jgi:hypothetical protein
LANENGTVGKVVEIRNRFLTGFREAAQTFDSEIRKLREAYLNELVDVALTDPRLSEVQRALSFKWGAPVVTTASQSLEEQGLPPTLSSTESTVPLPEKWPQKRTRVARCPTCNAVVQDVNARFCSQCAFPLFESQ